MSLADLRHAIATNSLTPDQQAPLLEALDALIPVFPDLAQGAIDGESTAAFANTWTAPLYRLAQVPGGPPPVSVASVVAHSPIVQTGTPENVVLDLPSATDVAAGAMAAADKAKIDGLHAGVQTFTSGAGVYVVTIPTQPDTNYVPVFVLDTSDSGSGDFVGDFVSLGNRSLSSFEVTINPDSIGGDLFRIMWQIAR